MRYNVFVSKHGVTICGITRDKEEIYIRVIEAKGKDYLYCIISSTKSNEPFDIDFKSEEVGFGNNLEKVNYNKYFANEMTLIESAKNSLKYYKKWANNLPKHD